MTARDKRLYSSQLEHRRCEKYARRLFGGLLNEPDPVEQIDAIAKALLVDENVVHVQHMRTRTVKIADQEPVLAQFYFDAAIELLVLLFCLDKLRVFCR